MQINIDQSASRSVYESVQFVERNINQPVSYSIAQPTNGWLIR